MLCFMDFEGTGGAQNEITQFGAVLTDDTCNLISNYTKLVKTEERITPFVEKLTNIKNEDLENAENFKVVLSDFYEWLLKNDVDIKNNILFIVWGQDFTTLKKNSMLNNCKELFFEIFQPNKRINYQKLLSQKVMKNGEIATRRISLQDMKSLLNITSEVQHNALDDAMDLRNVYLEVNIKKTHFNKKELDRIFLEKQQHIKKMKADNMNEKIHFYDYFDEFSGKRMMRRIDKEMFKFLKDGPAEMFNLIAKTVGENKFSKKNSNPYDENIWLEMYSHRMENGNGINWSFTIFIQENDIKYCCGKINFISTDENRRYMKKFIRKFWRDIKGE